MKNNFDKNSAVVTHIDFIKFCKRTEEKKISVKDDNYCKIYFEIFLFDFEVLDCKLSHKAKINICDVKPILQLF